LDGLRTRKIMGIIQIMKIMVFLSVFFEIVNSFLDKQPVFAISRPS